jgi:hypothetical protein
VRRRRLIAALAAAALVFGPGLSAVAGPGAGDEPDVVLSEDFSSGQIPDGWRPIEGDWSVVDGRLVGVSGSSSQQSRITFGPSMRDYRVEVTVRFEQVASPTRWTAVALDMPSDGSTPWWIATMRSGSSASNGLEFAQRTASNSWNVTDTAAAPGDAGTGRDVRVAIEVRGGRATWIYDGQPVLRTAALQRSSDGVLGLIVNGATVSFDDVVVITLGPEQVSRPMMGRAPTLLVEIKGPETPAELETTIDVIRERDMIDQVLVQSFDVQALRDVRQIEPNLRIALLRSTVDPDPVSVAKELGVVAYNPSWNSLRNRPEVVAELHDAGIAVMPYTINDPAQWQILRDLGVDAIITDRPGTLVGWNARHVQTVPDMPTVQLLSPADGTMVTRGEVVVPAVAAERADEIAITLDGEPVAEGALIDVDELALGEHVLEVAARGVRGQAQASATFTVEATAAGLARLVTDAEVTPSTRQPLMLAIDPGACWWTG